MIQIDYAVCFQAALLLMLLPLDWFISVVIAAVFHELCHIFMLYLLNGTMNNVKIGRGSCVIEASGMGEVKQFISILAGPLGSLLLIAFCRLIPKIGICGLIHGLFNLIPVLPLDGGRLLQLFLYHFCPQKTDFLMRVVAAAISIAAVVCTIWLSLAASAGKWPYRILLILAISIIGKKNSLQTAGNRGTIGVNLFMR